MKGQLITEEQVAGLEMKIGEVVERIQGTDKRVSVVQNKIDAVELQFREIFDGRKGSSHKKFSERESDKKASNEDSDPDSKLSNALRADRT